MLNWALSPTTNYPRELADKLANSIDNPQGEGGYGRGFLAGGMQGLGDVVSGMTSPLSIASTAMGLPFVSRAAKGLASLGRIIPDQLPQGIPPNQLPPDLIGRGMESGFNTVRQLPQAAIKSVDDLAYETIRRGPDPIGRNITGNFRFEDMMKKLNQARGR